jgi:hypothetical protein
MRLWEEDPVGQRERLINAAADPMSRLVAMEMATQEEASFLAFQRGESTIFLGDPEECPTCHKMMRDVFTGGKDPVCHTTPLYARPVTPRQPIWMGPERRWVCRMCMTPMPQVKYTPDMGIDIDWKGTRQ